MDQESPERGDEVPLTRKGVGRHPTGISGFDEVLGGGLPAGRCTLVTGTTGTGKTVLLNEFLLRGIESYGEGGVLVTFEEDPADIAQNLAGFGWDYPGLIAANRLAIVDCSGRGDGPPITKGGAFTWDVLFRRIQHAIEKTSARRVAIDSLTTAIGRLAGISESSEVRTMLLGIVDLLRAHGVTSLISAEKAATPRVFSEFTVEEFAADGVIALNSYFGQDQLLRELAVVKLRGLDFRSGKVEYRITGTGLEVYPKIPVNTDLAKTRFDILRAFGVPGLDLRLGGGVPQGHMVLIAGNTGTGKTLLGLQFLREGLERGEKAIWVALEEPVPQVRKTAAAMGWDLEAYEARGELRFLRYELIDLSPDRLQYDLLRACEELDASRVVLDSVSSIESSTLSPGKVREVLIQVSTYLKTRGTTCLMNYLSSANFGAPSAQLLGALQTNEMRLSSIVDGVLLLRYYEREHRVGKLLNVLKMRGCAHSREILEYEIGDEGFEVPLPESSSRSGT